MKFPRHSKILRSPFDVAPFAAVFFLLIMFLLISAFLPTPGVPLTLPAADGLAGTDQPSVSMAVDLNGSYYFEDQLVSREALAQALRAAAKNSPAPLTLVINADKAVTYDQLMQVTQLAWHAGITNALLATLPQPGLHALFRP